MFRRDMQPRNISKPTHSSLEEGSRIFLRNVGVRPHIYAVSQSWQSPPWWLQNSCRNGLAARWLPVMLLKTEVLAGSLQWQAGVASCDLTLCRHIAQGTCIPLGQWNDWHLGRNIRDGSIAGRHWHFGWRARPDTMSSFSPPPLPSAV
jgi:hypothetical protein